MVQNALLQQNEIVPTITVLRRNRKPVQTAKRPHVATTTGIFYKRLAPAVAFRGSMVLNRSQFRRKQLKYNRRINMELVVRDDFKQSTIPRVLSSLNRSSRNE